MIWFSVLALIPLSAVLVETSAGGWGAFWNTLTNPQTAAALRLTVTQAFLVTVVNVFMGTLIAWVLVRDHFLGKRASRSSSTSRSRCRRSSPASCCSRSTARAARSASTWRTPQAAVFLAFLFVTLPFVVRTVQPVLAELDRDVEEAAASLGASRMTTFRRVILPALYPAIFAGAALSFARGISEYGSLVLLSGNLPMRTEVGVGPHPELSWRTATRPAPPRSPPSCSPCRCW